MEAINHPEEVLYLTDVYRQRSEYAISKLSDIDGINIPQAKAAITQGNSTVRCVPLDYLVYILIWQFIVRFT